MDATALGFEARARLWRFPSCATRLGRISRRRESFHFLAALPLVLMEGCFSHLDAVTSVREYDTTDGHLVRVISPTKLAEFRKPRGLRFGPDGHLYCVAQDGVVAFDFTKGACLGSTVQFQRLNGQELAFFPPDTLV
jgi:hypothetical protein